MASKETYQFTCRCEAWLETDILARATCKRCDREYIVIDDTLIRPTVYLANGRVVQSLPDTVAISL